MAAPGLDLNSIRKLFSASDFFAAISLVVIIALMLLPLPTFFLDLLLTLSLAFSLLILLVAMFLKEPLEFAAFPSVLLVITVLRLSLNIAASRLILTNAYAGEVIAAFGSFVVGGKLYCRRHHLYHYHDC